MTSIGKQIIGVISDTHGLLRDTALSALAGCELIIHAGDVGAQEILDRLTEVARVVAVRGNMDGARWADALPDDEVVEYGGRSFYILHNPYELDLDPAAAGFDAVITGHTHQAAVTRQDGVLYLNPGSAGPRRTTRPATVAIVTANAAGLEVEIIELVD